MAPRPRRKKILGRLTLAIGVPVLVLAALELVLFLLPLDSTTIQVDRLSIEVPDWILSDESITKQFGHLADVDERIDVDDVFGFWTFFDQDRAYHYTLKPGLNTQVVNYFNPVSLRKRIKWTIDTNDRGYRGRAMPRDKEPGRFRIVCIGDSSTFGWGVEPDETFAHQLQVFFDRRYPGRIEVFNMGVPGYTSFQGKLLLGELGEYRPDLVIAAFGSNDATRAGADEKTLYQRWNSPGGRLALAFSRLRSYRLLRSALMKLSNPYDDLTQADLVRRVSLDDYEANLREILARAGEIDCHVFFLSVKQDDRYQEVLSRVARESGVLLVDYSRLIAGVAPAVMKGAVHQEYVEATRRTWGADEVQRNPELIFRVDATHPSPLGHYLIAQEIARHVGPTGP